MPHDNIRSVRTGKFEISREWSSDFDLNDDPAEYENGVPLELICDPLDGYRITRR